MVTTRTPDRMIFYTLDYTNLYNFEGLGFKVQGSKVQNNHMICGFARWPVSPFSRLPVYNYKTSVESLIGDGKALFSCLITCFRLKIHGCTAVIRQNNEDQQ